jgi:hypothetical protein
VKASERVNVVPNDLKIADRETALLDLLAGWLEMVESCRDAAELPREEFDREFFGDIVPETYDDWREHYTDGYLKGVDQLYARAAALVLGDEDEEPELTPAEFLREFVLPLFEGE